MKSGAWIFLGASLVIPGLVLYQLSAVLHYWLVLGVFLFLQGAALLAIYLDKSYARGGERRTPESSLHFIEAIGGWPGSFLAQRMFHHKTAKRTYQVKFYLIVLVHQLSGLEFLLDFPLSHLIGAWMTGG